MNRQLFLIGYDEIGLKGRNRQWFIKRLLKNIARQTGIPVTQLSHYQKRIYMDVPEKTDLRSLVTRLEKVFGISWFARVDDVGFDDEELLATGIRRGAKHTYRGDKTFKVETRRSNKEYPKRSYEINNELGEAIRTQTELEVDVHHPDVIFNVEVREKGIYLYTDRHKGPAGLPTGSGGRILSLFSGGIDSPVVAWQLMKRGLHVDLVHFHSPPYTGEKVLEKVRDAGDVLQQWSGEEMTVRICPFTEIQEVVADKIPERYWTIIHRRFMIRIAERIADKENYGALATGDSIGQVASQTLSNLSVTDQATEKLVIRPLVGMNKPEIIKMAKSIGTFGISTQPFEDCCVLFAPGHPATTSNTDEIRKLEERLDVDRLVAQSLENIRKQSLCEARAEL